MILRMFEWRPKDSTHFLPKAHSLLYSNKIINPPEHNIHYTYLREIKTRKKLIKCSKNESMKVEVRQHQSA